jgi:bifunctional non-homologous end joining protein LigD
MSADLDVYRAKRNFDRTSEPRGGKRASAAGRLQFVVHKHAARRLHYDFRLEYAGVLKSWAVPKGPSLDPEERRLAVQTEDHPLEYAGFEGVIPEREYGAGAVLIWDRGYWTPEGDAESGLEKGKLDFSLAGDKLRGRWTLVRMPPKRGARKESKDNWLLIKHRDREARDSEAQELVETRPESVLSGREIGEVASAGDRVWHSRGGEAEPVLVPEVGRPDTLAGARQAALPEALAPQLASLVDVPPEGPGWFHEPKLDGYRLLCRIDEGQVRLLTRRGHDWTERFAAIEEAARALPCRTALLDGEAVVIASRGLSSFQELQAALASGKGDIALVAFDLLYLDGWDLRGAPLRSRKELLRLLLSGAPRSIGYGDHLETSGAFVFKEACRLGMEGIVSKRAADPYRSERSRSWLKIKCQRRQELSIVGFTDPGGSRAGFGALLVGTRDAPGEPLRYAGRVGTGFDDRTLRSLRARLDPLLQRAPSVSNPPRGAAARGVHWVKPELVAEIGFGEWTQEGVLRHPVFHGLREDKRAEEVVTERALSAAEPEPDAGPRVTAPEVRPSAAPVPAAAPANTPPALSAAALAKEKPVRVAGVKLSHPSKLLFPETGITKRQLASYWEQVAEHALPLLRDRPLTLLRCPEGQGQPCFYQKHIGAGVAEAVPRVSIKADEEPYATVDALPALIGLVQMGVLELHVWGSRQDRLDQPDQLVLDLDPSEELPFGRVVEAALELRERVQALGLLGFVRLTGGKGLHVVVPVVPGPRWPAVKQFTQALAQELVRDQPTRFTAVMSKSRRGGKIFIDYLRNAREATAIGSYSPRAKPGAPVALPVAWEELDPKATEPPRHGLLDVPELLRRRKVDPWRDFEASRRPLE